MLYPVTIVQNFSLNLGEIFKDNVYLERFLTTQEKMLIQMRNLEKHKKKEVVRIVAVFLLEGCKKTAI